MTGLISRENLVVSLPQLCWVVFSAWGWLSASNLRRWIPLFLAGSLIMFWGDMLCFDTRITWNQLERFSGRLPTLQEMAYVNHLKFQPPLWTWWLCLRPGYGWQQIYAVCLSGGILGACYVLYEADITRYIGACPLFVLACSQPLNGLYALAFLLLGRVAWYRGSRLAAVGLVWLACSLKYTMYALMPVFVWEFRGWSALLLGSIGAYWLAFWHTESLVYVRQAEFLWKMFSLGASGLKRHGDVSRIVRRNVDRLPRLGKSGPAMLFYAWPLLGVLPWYVVSLGVLMFIGGGNVKYLILLFGILPNRRDGNGSYGRISAGATDHFRGDS